MPDIVARLPESERHRFKDPMGPIFRDPEQLLETAGTPIVAVGDVVAYHLASADHTPTLAVVDGMTEREVVDDAVEAGLPGTEKTIRVANPAATITRELVDAIEEALSTARSTTIDVDGEEDLAVLPAILLAPDGATIVYGQPGEGMVAVQVDESTREACLELLSHLEVDEAFWADLR